MVKPKKDLLRLINQKSKIGGGNGGHNGIKSIESRIGKEFHRLRIGIGRPEHKDQVSDYVLSNFSSTEMEHVNTVLYDICKFVFTP